MADSTFIDFYREIFADLSLDAEECDSFQEKLSQENPPPAKLSKLRSLAFRTASDEFTDECDSPTDLIKCLNAIVHSIEMTCLIPKAECEDVSEDDFELDSFVEQYQSIYEDKSISFEEGQQMQEFFSSHPIPVAKVISTRATIFKTACSYWNEDNVDDNKSLLRCIDVIVYFFETAYMDPKPYVLGEQHEEEDISVETCGIEDSISKAVQKLYDLDVNRLTPGDDYVVNVQGGKKVYWAEDKAEEPLFSYVRVHELQSRPTYKYFVALLDNYSSETGSSEDVSSTERSENWRFLHAIMETAPMQFCHKYLLANNADDVPDDTQEFKQLLYKIWFELYSRSRGCRGDSSGFEHVFVGEIKDDKVSGFHNWIQYYLEEKRGNVDYRGYIKPRCHDDASANDDDRVLTLQFTWHGVEKSVGTTFVGVSPEFEMALFTLCFLMGQECSHVQLNTGTDVFDLNIKCYSYGHHQIGTSYPEAVSHSEA